MYAAEFVVGWYGRQSTRTIFFSFGILSELSVHSEFDYPPTFHSVRCVDVIGRVYCLYSYSLLIPCISKKETLHIMLFHEFSLVRKW